MNKEFDVAESIYNLSYQTKLKENNFKYDIDLHNKIVKHIYFIKEDKTISFGKITSKELFNYFF